MTVITKSPNQLSHSEDWSRYDSPTVVRRHGREFLERTWKASLSPTPGAAPSNAGLLEIIRAQAGIPITLAGVTLLFFSSEEQAIACETRLSGLGVSLLREGKHLQMRGVWL